MKYLDLAQANERIEQLEDIMEDMKTYFSDPEKYFSDGVGDEWSETERRESMLNYLNSVIDGTHFQVPSLDGSD